ncbi:MAG: type II toxin-antitoxin system VapC family toxin [Arachnia sp.]
MTDERGLIDTNVLILLADLDPEDLPETSLVSAITLAELSVAPLATDNDLERARRQAHVQQAEADFDAIAFGKEAARAFGRVAASLRSQGRKPAARAYDALIAATALAEGLPLYTCNPRDYVGIDGLTVREVRLPQ